VKKNRRIIFKLASAVDIIRKLSANYFWHLTKLIRADPENQIPYELHIKSDDDDFEVIYVEDPISECNYVIVSGEDQEKACSLIQENIEFWTSDEMFSAWANALNDTAQILAILRIGVGAPYEYDKLFTVKLMEGLEHTDASVREAALAAVGYREWDEFDAILKIIVENDSDERCRNRAEFMLGIRKKERTLVL